MAFLGAIILQEERTSSVTQTPRYTVIDGQQRIQALRNIGVEESFQIPAVVLELEGNGDVVKEEASVFNQINMGKMKLSRLENFWGLVRSGDDKANDVLSPKS